MRRMKIRSILFTVEIVLFFMGFCMTLWWGLAIAGFCELVLRAVSGAPQVPWGDPMIFVVKHPWSFIVCLFCFFYFDKRVGNFFDNFLDNLF